jgi:hypothetical protein
MHHTNLGGIADILQTWKGYWTEKGHYVLSTRPSCCACSSLRPIPSGYLILSGTSTEEFWSPSWVTQKVSLYFPHTYLFSVINHHSSPQCAHCIFLQIYQIYIYPFLLNKTPFICKINLLRFPTSKTAWEIKKKLGPLWKSWALKKPEVHCCGWGQAEQHWELYEQRFRWLFWKQRRDIQRTDTQGFYSRVRPIIG